MFGAEDPDGLRCPFGAHIRRANPRDSFAPGSRQLEIINHHRILRVGRIYGAQEGSDREGLLFMCVNADIERQFEFLQQTWIRGSSFHGQEREMDPVVGPQARAEGNGFTIPTSTGPVSLKGLRDFVTVRGGAYFFMPGKDACRRLIGPSLR
jgi:deferrochelatase/peroxidase EfeB